MPKRKRVRKFGARVRRSVGRYRSFRRSGGFGQGFNIKTMAAGAIGLLAAKKIVGPNSLVRISLGDYDGPAQNITAGIALHMLKLDNRDLITAGVKQGLATAADNIISGKGLGFGVGSTATIGGGGGV